ncbi:hypothetical protein NX059_004821 [Plenodomus lindquistii]|nr:hypothetical protein NX059_004821 [Plenodomus lindquistii]
MRSFAVIAGLAAAVSAAAYPQYPVASPSSMAPEYPVASPSSKAPEYPVASPSSKAPEYPVASPSSKAPEYPVASPSSKAPEYPVANPSSKAPEYPVASTTKIVTGLTTVCPEPTTITYGTKTITVSKSTTLVIPDITMTTVYPVKPTAHVPVYSQAPPAHSSGAVVPYPSQNATVPAYTPPASTGVKPSGTKPATPEFTGAAAQAGVGLLAVVGAIAAFL